MMKLVVAIIAATGLSSWLGFVAEEYIGGFNVPIASLSGLQGFQLLDITSLLGLIPAFVWLVDRLHEKLAAGRYTHWLFAILGCAIGLWIGVQLVSCLSCADEWPDLSVEVESEDPDVDKAEPIRLTEDEPGEFHG